MATRAKIPGVRGFARTGCAKKLIIVAQMSYAKVSLRPLGSHAPFIFVRSPAFFGAINALASSP
jgi:hypothetical protein